MRIADAILILKPGKLAKDVISVELVMSKRGLVGFNVRVAFMELFVGILKKVFRTSEKEPL